MENIFDTMKSFCPYSQPIMFSPKHFDNFSPEGGCSEDLLVDDAFRFVLNSTNSITHN